MASGDITTSSPVLCTGASEVQTAINALNLAAATDFVFVIPIEESNNQFYVFKAEREA